MKLKINVHKYHRQKHVTNKEVAQEKVQRNCDLQPERDI